MKPVNLLPQDQRRRMPSEGGGKGAYAVLGVLALLLVMAAAYVLTGNQVTERDSKAAAASSEADRLEAEAAKQASYTDFAAIAQTRLASVAGVAGSRFDWERLMRELSRIMPEGSWLQSADASVLGDLSATGGVAPAAPTDPAVAAAPATPAASLVGCAPRQTDTARMMVRLRAMHRVEDVELNESSRESANEDVTVENCGSYYKFDLTVTFSGAPAVSEAPRNSDRVPASLGGGS
jgi:Tfp pilus assembly protein PilN